MQDSQGPKGAGPVGHQAARSAGSRGGSRSQLQRAYVQINLGSYASASTPQTKQFFVMVPQDSSFQRLLVSAAADTALQRPMNIKMRQASGSGFVDLSESHLITRLTQQPTSLRASRSWSGQGAVYLDVTAYKQSVVAIATLEFLTSEIP